MPIATCYLSDKIIGTPDFKSLIIEWAGLIGVEEKDITLNIIRDFEQYGKKYEVMVNLFLPSLWDGEKIEIIQKSLVQLLSKYVSVQSQDIFIMTSIIQSGHVVSNGKIEKW